ncbi:MAG: Ppx/GppA phosphatase family protein [Fimbriimonadaceae bacterium]
MGTVLAAADVGSNTVHLLVADVNGLPIRRILNESVWVSLGEEVSRIGSISDEREAQIIRTLNDFKSRARSAKATRMYVFGTEALRRARNSADVLRRVLTQTGIPIDVIDSQREIQLSLQGALLDTTAPAPLAFFEIGGGSAQVAQFNGYRIDHCHSLPIGTGSLIAAAGLSQPCRSEAIDRAEEVVRAATQPVATDGRVLAAIASGGVARGLVRALHHDGARDIHLEELEYLIWAVARLDVNAIMQRFLVKEKRASTLLPGAIVYRALLRRFGLTQMLVSEYGVREGALLEMREGAIEGWPA